MGPSVPTRTSHAGAALDLRLFWEAQLQNRLLIPRCTECTAWHFPPRETCAVCGANASTWGEASGRGVLYSIMATHPASATLNGEPRLIAVVELEEGPRILAELVGIETEAASGKIGAPLTAVFSPEREYGGGSGPPLCFRPL